MVYVKPNAARNQVLGLKDGVLYLKIASPPVKDMANRELVSFLSDILRVPKSSLTIEKGATSRTKLVGVSGLTLSQLEEKMRNLIQIGGEALNE